MAINFYTEEQFRNMGEFVTFSRSGNLWFNSGAVRKYKLTKGQQALIGYDPDIRKVVIKFIDEYLQGARKVMLVGNSATISTELIFRYFGIKHTKTKRYTLQKDADGELFFIINKEGTEAI